MSHKVGIRDPDTKLLYNSSTRHSGLDTVCSLAQVVSKEKVNWMPDQVRHDSIKFYNCSHIIHVTGPIHNIGKMLIQAKRGGQDHA
jgi:hypothetical protein